MTGVMETGLSGSGPPPPDYNLFRRIEDPEFFCAVAQDKPVPPFLTADVWQFVGGGPEASRGLLAHRAAHASAGDRLDGFYLFYARCGVEHPALLEMEEAA